MAPSISRSLFIGLGGIGVKTILDVKAMYEGELGCVPDITAFIGIDLSSTRMADVSLDLVKENEFSRYVSLYLSDPKEYYNEHRSQFNWMPDDSVNLLDSLTRCETEQYRTNGRFAFIANIDKIEKTIREAVYSISSVTEDRKGRWRLDDGRLHVYLVFSACGGIGSGAFADMSFLLRYMYPHNIEINAYCISSGIFPDCGKRGLANTYSTLLDADYLMSTISHDNPFHYSAAGDEIEISEKPFDIFYLIDNVNSKGDIIKDPDDLISLLKHAIYSSSCPMSSAIAANFDNVKMLMNDGSLDVDGQKAWISGLGFCEVGVVRQKLLNRYKLELIKELSSNLKGNNIVEDLDSVTLSWIDANSLREHEADQLLDSLYDMTRRPRIVIESRHAAEAREEVEEYKKVIFTNAVQQIQEQYDLRLSFVKNALSQVIQGTIVHYGGFLASISFLNKLESYLNQYLNEMKEEFEAFSSRLERDERYIDETIEAWSHKKIFSRIDYAGDLEDYAELFMNSAIEKERHEKAIQFFTALLNTVNDYQTRLESSLFEMSKAVDQLIAEYSENSSYEAICPYYLVDITEQVRISYEQSICSVEAFMTSLRNQELISIGESPVSLCDSIDSFITEIATPIVSNYDLGYDFFLHPEYGLMEKAHRKADILLSFESGKYDIPDSLINMCFYTSSIRNIHNNYLDNYSNAPILVTETKTENVLIYHYKGVLPFSQIAVMEKNKKAFNVDGITFWARVKEKAKKVIIRSQNEPEIKETEHLRNEVFISYSRKDTDIADRICRSLEKAGITYFIDRQGIEGGMEFPRVLAEAIVDCKLFLFLGSENSYNSKYTNSEVTFAFNKKTKSQILPYIIDGSTLPIELQFQFSNINIRNITDHPIEGTLVRDIAALLKK